MPFSDEKIQAVWEKGTVVENYDSTKYRKDMAGAWMQRDKYGDQSTYGWEIDHVYPASKGGTDNLINLRPMQWENNQNKNDDYPSYRTAVGSDGNKNIAKEQSFTVNEGLQTQLKQLHGK